MHVNPHTKRARTGNSEFLGRSGGMFSWLRVVGIAFVRLESV